MNSLYQTLGKHGVSGSGIRQDFGRRTSHRKAWRIPLHVLQQPIYFLRGAFVVCVALASASRLVACPFCSAVASTLREDIAASDYVALAVCKRVGVVDADLPTHVFRLTHVVRGERTWMNRDVPVLTFKPFSPGDVCLLFGVGDTAQADWGPTEPLSKAAQNYVLELANQMHSKPAQPASMDIESGDATSTPHLESAQSLACDDAWLRFFWKYLADGDAWIRKDAFNEFARASLDDLRSAVAVFNPVDLRERIADRAATVEARRLYWTLLSLCDRSRDSTFPEAYIFANAETPRALLRDEVGLDAAISCYLVLGGETALARIEEKLLKNQQAHYSDRYAAISALRVHASEFDVLPKTRICEALSQVLWDPNMADLVIPDLARLNDWSHIKRLIELFKSAENEQQFLRMPVINYLRACPLPEALEECRRMDPDAYRRAVSFFRVPAAE